MMRKFFSGVLSSLSLLPVLYTPAGAQNAEKSAAVAVADQIHFSIISTTAVTFDWIGSMDSIYYGTDKNNLAESMRAIPAEFLPVTFIWVSDPGPYWEAKLTGLQENTEYAYKIGASGEVSTFRTPPRAGKGGLQGLYHERHALQLTGVCGHVRSDSWIEASFRPDNRRRDRSGSRWATKRCHSIPRCDGLVEKCRLDGR